MKKNFWITASIIQKVDKLFASKKRKLPSLNFKKTSTKVSNATEKKK